MWQDIVMSCVSVAFAYALVPQVIYSWKRKSVELSWQTLIITTIGICIMCVCFLTLGLYFTTVTNGTCGLLWITLLTMKIKYLN